MSGGVTLASVATYAGLAASAFSIYNAVTAKSPKGADAQAIKPVAPPQESKTPDADVFRDKNARAGSAAGMTGSTLLTQLGGVPNAALNLGKNTLLGA